MRTRTAAHGVAMRSIVGGLVACALGATAATVSAQVVLTDSGMASYSYPIALPPGIGGMVPKLALSYTGGPNGPVGQGWSLQGVSAITRCAPTRAVDGDDGTLKYSVKDKLCLNGQRLIQTDSAGAPLPFPQANDAAGLESYEVREFRTEKDASIRVRAYGKAYSTSQSSSEWGPKYFVVWTRSGRVQTYGSRSSIPSSTTALIGGSTGVGPGPAWAWALAREADAAGNYIDYAYDVRALQSGTGEGGTPSSGVEWNVSRIDYTGNTTTGQLPTASIQFEYVDRPGSITSDRSETTFAGIKKLSVRLLDRITISADPNLQPRRVKLSYGNGAVTGRTVLQSIRECAGVGGNSCLPATTFAYAGGSRTFGTTTSFGVDSDGIDNGLSTLAMTSTQASAGVIAGDFNGDGRTDILRWSNTPANNRLFLSEGNGNYRAVPIGTGPGQFNITDQNLFKGDSVSKRIDLCYASVVADFDGDGLSDILRYASSGINAANTNGTSACPAGDSSYLYRSNGDGSFTRSTVRNSATQAAVPLLRAQGVTSPDGLSVSNYGHFLVGDFNRDGKMDIASTRAESGNFQEFVVASVGRPGIYCTGTSQSVADRCGVTIWLGNGDGSFASTRPSLFKPGGESGGYNGYWTPYLSVQATSHAFDGNADGVPDISYPSRTVLQGGVTKLIKGGYYIGSKVAEFSVDTAPALPDCTSGAPVSGDYNGDGTPDSICFTGSGSQAKLATGTGRGYAVQTLTDSFMSVAGGSAIDVDGDGKSDILHLRDSWSDGAGPTKVFRSYGNGRFVDITSESGLYGVTLSKTDRSVQFVSGNFSGSGALEFLVFNSTPTSTPNKLYVKTDAIPADLLTSVTSPTGAVTTVKYESLTKTSRYASDRGTAQAAVYPAVDLTIPMVVATQLTTDSGVGTAKNVTEFAYRGFKGDHHGRGSQGFREIRQQTDSPDGTSKLTQVRQNLQVYPYTGSPAVSETYLGALSPIGSAQAGLKLSRTENIYCDLKAAAGAENTATVTAPCPVTAKIQRPYLRKTIQTGWDLAGTALPTTTTTTTFTGDYPTLIEGITVGSGPAGVQTFTKSTVNEYWPDNTSADNWILGLVKKSTASSTVPNSLSSITTSAGTAPKATATAGP